MVRRLVIAIGCLALVLAVGGAGWWLTIQDRGDDGGEPAARSSSAAPDEREQDAAEVATMLTALPKNPAAAVPAGHKVGADARQAMPATAVVRPQPDTWLPDGLGGGTMTVTVSDTGTREAAYSVIVVHEPDGWKVAATMRLAE